MRRVIVVAAVMLALGATAYAAEQRLRFWNTTAETIVELYLAPPGTGQWGPNQCLNDPDKSVDADERLTITGVTPGRYDVRAARQERPGLSGAECRAGGGQTLRVLDLGEGPHELQAVSARGEVNRTHPPLGICALYIAYDFDLR